LSFVLVLVAAGSAAAGIVTSGGAGSPGGQATIVATSPVVTLPPAPPVASLPVPPPTVAPAKPAPSAQPDALLTWPARDGYTVVISSIPVLGGGLSDARSKAKDALARGLRRVGVLDSSRFASLHPGYYVVFAGVYGSLEEAETAVGRLASRFPNAYAREIVR
jgi:hypothetical protein